MQLSYAEVPSSHLENACVILLVGMGNYTKTWWMYGCTIRVLAEKYEIDGLYPNTIAELTVLAGVPCFPAERKEQARFYWEVGLYLLITYSILNPESQHPETGAQPRWYPLYAVRDEYPSGCQSQGTNQNTCKSSQNRTYLRGTMSVSMRLCYFPASDFSAAIRLLSSLACSESC